MCWLFHRWGKWEPFEVFVPGRKISTRWALMAAIDHRQKRTCLRCGKVQDELIRTEVKE